MADTGSKILVTGGSGFIGTHLCRELVDQGYYVRVLDIRPPRFQVPEVHYEFGDVRNPKNIARAVEDIEAVFHLAAMVSVPLCQENPVESYQVNLLSTIAVLEALVNERNRIERPIRFIFSGSSVVYGNLGQESRAISESDPTDKPQSFYGAQKLASEQATQLFQRHFNIPSVIFRFFNVYGPGMDPSSPYSGVISVFAQALSAGAPIRIHGDGSQTRDFVSVHDVVGACLDALSLPSSECDANPINLGSGEKSSILELAQEMILRTNRPAQIQNTSGRAGDVKHSLANVERAKKILKWEPQIKLTQGLAELF